MEYDHFIDLCGKKCPLTFVFTKVELEKLEKGRVLKAVYDYKPAFFNVPRSVKVQKLAELIHEEKEGNKKIFWFKRI